MSREYLETVIRAREVAVEHRWIREDYLEDAIRELKEWKAEYAELDPALEIDEIPL